MIQKIATTAVYVEDQEQALVFWRDKVGFEVVANYPMAPGASWLEVAPTGAETALVIYSKSMMKNWEELKPSIVFLCDDIRTTYEEMKSRGVNFAGEPQTMNWGTFVQFADEEGYHYLLKG
ncbi:VOC family protein [Risungbinella massiliensis]|uniref:VOC family protein n=1 Tax=Risungbinella massiliensis TaxID=1329796 RepID=UPI0005CBC002|nr:VOC family protein [Risungbinella massiliensis]